MAVGCCRHSCGCAGVTAPVRRSPPPALGASWGPFRGCEGDRRAVHDGLYDGLWLILEGWFVLSASTAEEHTVGLDQAMATLTVADVMSSDPIRLPAYQIVDALVDLLTAIRQDTFPVFDLQGRVVGIVDIDTLVRLPAPERHSRRVGDVAIPAERLPTATSEESVRDVQQQLAQAPAVLAFEGADLVGTVTVDDITWAARQATLRSARRWAVSRRCFVAPSGRG